MQSDNNPYSSRRMRSSNSRTNSSFNDSAALYDTRRSYSDSLSNQDKLRNLSNRALAEFAYGKEDESMDKASMDRLSRLVQAQAPASDVGVKIYEEDSENVNLSALRTALQGYHDAEPEKKSYGSSQAQLDSTSYSNSDASQSYTPSASKLNHSDPSHSSSSSYSVHNSSSSHSSYAPSSNHKSYSPSGSHGSYNASSHQSGYNSGSNHSSDSSSYHTSNNSIYHSSNSTRSSQTGYNSASYASNANISGDWHTNAPKKTATERVDRKVDLSEHTSIISSGSPTQQSNRNRSQSSNVPSSLRSQQSHLSSSVHASGLNVQAHNIAASAHASNETETLDTHSSQHSVFGSEYSHGKANAKDANGYGGYNQIGRTSKHSLQHMGHAPIGYTAQASATYHAHSSADKAKMEQGKAAQQPYGYGSTGFTSSNVSSAGNTSGDRSHLRSEQGHNEHSSFASAAEASKARKQHEAQQVHNAHDSDLNSFTAITSATTGQSAYAAQRAAHMQGPSGRKVAAAALDQAAHGSSPVSGQTDAASDVAHSYTNRMSRSNARSAAAPQIGRQAPRANTTLNAVSFGPAAAAPQPKAGEYVSAVNPYEMTQINAAKQGNESYSLNSNSGFGALTHEFDAHRNAGSVVTKHTVRKSKVADIAGYAAQNDYGFSSPASRSNGAFKTSDTNVLRNASTKTGDSIIQRTVSNYVRVPVQSSSTCIVRSTPTYVSERATVFVTASGNKTIVGVESAKPVEPLKTIDASKPVAIEAQAQDEAATESTVANVADVIEAAKAVESEADKANEQLAAEEAAKVIDKATENSDAQADSSAAESATDSTSKTLAATPDRRATAIVKDGTESSTMITSIEGTAQQPSPGTSTVVTGVRNEVAPEEQTEDRVRIVRTSASPFVPSPEGKLAAALGTVFSEQEFKGSVIGNTPAEFLKAKPSAAQMEEAPAISAPKSNADFIAQEVLVGNSSTRIVTYSQRLKQSFARSAQISEEIKAEEIKKQEAASEQADSPATVISVHDIMHKVELTATQAKAAAQASANAHAMIEADLEVTDSKAGKNYGFAEISLILPKSDQNDAADSEEHTPIYAQVPIQIHAEPKARKQTAVQQAAQPAVAAAQPAAAAAQPAAAAAQPGADLAAAPVVEPVATATKPAAKPAASETKASTQAKTDKVENNVAQEQPKANAQKSKSESFKDNKKQNKNNKQEKAAKNNAAKQKSTEEVTATAHTVVTAKESSVHSVDHLKEEIAKTEDKKETSAKIEAKADEAYKAADNALKATSEEDKVVEAAKAVATEPMVKETKAEAHKAAEAMAETKVESSETNAEAEEQVSTLVYKQDEAVPYSASYDADAQAFADPIKAASAAVREALHAEAEAHSHGGSVAEQTAETLSGSAVDNATAVPMHNLLEGVSADTDLISGDDDLGKVADLGRVSDAPIDSQDVVLSALAEGATKDDTIVDKHIVNRNRRNKNRSRNKRR